MQNAARVIHPSQDHAGINASERLIVALDVPDLDEAQAVVRELGDKVLYYKVGPHLFLSGLINFIERDLVGAHKKVFLDFKNVDIGDTMRRMASRVSALGVDFLTVMGTAGTIIAAKEGREGRPIPKILAVTLLTDHDEADMQREYKTDKSLIDFVVERALDAEKAGADGVICSPKEAAAVRRALLSVRPDFLIVTPGVRPEGSSGDGQKRTGTPSEAIAAGADYIVVGRPIIKEANKLQAAGRILDEMQAALDAPRLIRAVG
jgi:orotidine-5'-phosphate decarboxylase